MFNLLPASIAANAALSDAIDSRNTVAGAGLVYIPGWTAASLGFQVSEELAGVYSPLRSSSGAVVEVTGIQTGTGAWYPLPAHLNGAAFFKLWSQTSGSSVVQTAARSLLISIKG